jgi:hypothetical protein
MSSGKEGRPDQSIAGPARRGAKKVLPLAVPSLSRPSLPSSPPPQQTPWSLLDLRSLLRHPSLSVRVSFRRAGIGGRELDRKQARSSHGDRSMPSLDLSPSIVNNSSPRSCAFGVVDLDRSMARSNVWCGPCVCRRTRRPGWR